MSRSAYCNTSYDLEKWLPNLHRLVLIEDMSGTDGIFPSGTSSFVSSTAKFSAYGFETNDTLIIAEGESNEGVYHIQSIVSDNVLILSHTAVTSATQITWQATKLFNRVAQDASDIVDEELADLSHIISVPFDRVMLEEDLSALDDLDESIPLSLRGYYLDLEMQSASYPIGITLTGYGEYLDWRNAGISSLFTTDTEKRPVTISKSLTESLTFTAAGTLTTSNRWREVTDISASSTSGTLTVRLSVPRTIKRLAALETAIQLMIGNYIQGRSNRSEWIEQMIERRDKIYNDYRRGVRKIAELTESTVQRGKARSVRISRI